MLRDCALRSDALRARQVSFAQGRALAWMVLKGMVSRPGAFLWPPRAAMVEKRVA